MSSQIARRWFKNFYRNETQDAGGETIELSPAANAKSSNCSRRGYLYKEIAEMLKISVQTVNTYIRRIYEKLHVRSRAPGRRQVCATADGRNH